MINEDPTAEELYERWLQLSDQYRQLVTPDPDMLSDTDEAKRLCDRVDRAWNEYYYTKYPERKEDPMLDRFHGKRPIGY